MLFTGGSPPQAENFGDFEALKHRFIRGEARRRREKNRDFRAPKWDFQGGIGQKWSKFGHWPKLSVPITPPPRFVRDFVRRGGGLLELYLLIASTSLLGIELSIQLDNRQNS